MSYRCLTVCCRSYLPIAEGCSVLRNNFQYLGPPKSYTVIYKPCLTGLGTYSPYVYEESPLDHLAAVRERLIGTVPGSSFESYRHTLRKMVQFVGESGWGVLHSLTFHEVLSHYVGRSRQYRRYKMAYEDIMREGLRAKDADAQGFMKKQQEGLLSMESLRTTKFSAPRMINHRSYKWILNQMRFLMPLEHALYRLTGKLSWGFATETPLYSKTRNMGEIANLIIKKRKGFRNPIVWSMDMKRFEMHVSKCVKWMERKFATKFFRGKDFHELDNILKRMVSARVKSKFYNYVIYGRHCSGDANTSFVACLSCVALFLDYATSHALQHFDILDNGDDMLIFIEGDDEHLLSDIIPWYEMRGFELNLTNRALIPEEVVFCRQRPVEYMPNKFRMTGEPKSTIFKLFGGTKFTESAEQQAKLLVAKTMSLAAMTRGIPLYQRLAQSVLVDVGAKIPLKTRLKWSKANWNVADLGYEYILGPELRGKSLTDHLSLDVITMTFRPYEVSQVSRVSFWRAWGIIPTTQELWEEEMLHFHILLAKPKQMGLAWDTECDRPLHSFYEAVV